MASSGARAGDSAAADLELVPADDSLQSLPASLGLRDTTTRLPLIGWTTLDPAAVGGTDTGALDSREPASPGVLVIERHTSRSEAPIEIMLRLGAEANRRDQVRFDGGYFALTVRRIGDQGFAGSWASAAGIPTAHGLLLRHARCRIAERRDHRMGVPPLDDGGAGNRTLVRVSIQNRVYVRRLVFLPSPRVGAEPTSPRPSS